MKKLLCVLGLSVAMVSGATFAADAKVGVVNVAAVFDKMPEREKATKQLENEFKGRVAELQKMEKDMQAVYDKLQSKGASMKKAEREKLEKDLNTKSQSYQVKRETFEKDNARRQGEERNKMLLKIQKAVETVAKKGNYTVIVDANAAAYADPATDITEKVISQVK